MREITLHLLDIVENSIAAQATSIQVFVLEDLAADQLIARVEDNGKGMTPEMVESVIDPFVTSRTTRKVGLGIPLFKAAAEASNGTLWIESDLGQGTSLTAAFQRSHIDRMPLGDLPGTLLAMLVAHPEVHWKFTYQARYSAEEEPESFDFDDLSIKEILGDISLTEPEVLTFLRGELEEGIFRIQNKLQFTDSKNSIPFSFPVNSPGN
jgi:hypothetical protein